jgi:hypothetical protein
VGTTSTATWKFTPNCTGTKQCTTTAVRPRLSGHPATVTSVTAFKGNVALVFTPTAVGQSHGCRTDKIALGVRSLSRLQRSD